MLVAGLAGQVSARSLDSQKDKSETAIDTLETAIDTLANSYESRHRLGVSSGSSLTNNLKIIGLSLRDTPVFAQNISANYGPFSLSSTANYDINDQDFVNVINHLSITLPITENTAIYGRATQLNVNGEEWIDALLLSAGARMRLGNNRDATLTQSFMRGLGGGSYTQATLSQNIPLTQESSANLTGRLSYNNRLLRRNSEFSHAEVEVSYAITSGRLSLIPKITYYEPFSDAISRDVTIGATLKVDLK